MSYLSRHRPICSVIQEIREIAEKQHNGTIMLLCDEARGYAESMSRKLMEYKKREEETE